MFRTFTNILIITSLSIYLTKTDSLSPDTHTTNHTPIDGSGYTEIETEEEPPDQIQNNETETIQTTNNTIKIEDNQQHISNNTRRIGISIEDKGTFHQKHNYVTVMIPQHLGNYSDYIETLINMTDKTIVDTKITLHNMKRHFIRTPFKNKTRNTRDKICSEQQTINRTEQNMNLTKLCDDYAFNGIIRKALNINIEVHKTTHTRIEQLQTKMHDIMEAFTISENRKKRSNSPFSFIGDWESYWFDVATGQDIRQVKATLEQMTKAQGTLSSTLEDVVIFNDWTKEHLINVGRAVKQLQLIIINLGRTLKNKINKIGIENNTKFTLNIASITITTTAFLKINNICTSIETEVQRLANSIGQAINGNLNIDTISPNNLLKSIELQKAKLKPTEKFLWHEKEDIIKIYKHARVCIYREDEGKTLITTFKIPVVKTNTNTKIEEINILPFKPTKNSENELIVDINENTNQLYIIKIEEEIYKISKDDISKETKQVYMKNILDKIGKNNENCIKSILTENTTEILTNCGTKKNEEKFIITQTNNNKYTFYSRKNTEIELECPVINEIERTKTHRKNLTGYGTLLIPEYCTLKTPKKMYIGNPIELDKIVIEQKHFTMTKMVTNDEIDTNLLKTIIETNNELNRQDLIKIVQQIEEIKPINDSEYTIATTKLRDEILMKIKLAEEQLSKVKELLDYFDEELEPTIGSVILISTLLLIILLYMCIKMNRKQNLMNNSRFREHQYPKIIKITDKNTTPLLNLQQLKRKRTQKEITSNIAW